MKQCKQLVSEKSAEDYTMLAQDEAGVRLGACGGYGWMLKADGCEVGVGFHTTETRIIRALGPDAVHVKVVESINADIFIEFLKELRQIYKKFVMFLDNFSAHKAVKVARYIESTDGDVILVYLPKYSIYSGPCLRIDKNIHKNNCSYLKLHLCVKNMVRSDMQILREEIRRITTEFDEFKDKSAKSEKAMTEKIRQLTLENDAFKLQIAENNRRFAMHDSEHSPSSTNSTYNAERDKFRKSRAKKEQAESAYDGTDTEDVSERRGPPKGHTGVSHNNKAERTVVQNVYRCSTCGGRSLQQISPKIKMVYDFADNDSMQVECVAYVIEKAVCNRCNAVSTGIEPTINGTSLGPKALGFILEYYAKRSTDETIAYYFDVLYGFGISPNTIWNARKALRDLLEGQYKSIIDTISQAPYIQMDESWIKINGKKGYVWLVTVRDATYIVVNPSRSAVVLDLHFSRLYDIPVVVDGYAAYNRFTIRQRCWVHLLREAEKLAIRRGGNDLCQYDRLLNMYNSIKNMDMADAAQCRDLEKHVLEIAMSYGETHKFRTTIEGAAPYLFTFLRYPGMPPHNNDAERDIRDTSVL